MTLSCAMFCDQALNSSGVRQSCCPNSVNVFRKECGLEIGQTRRFESLANNFADRCRIQQHLQIEASDFEMAAGFNDHPSGRKKRIVLPPKPLYFQECHPFGENAENFRSNWIKIGHEGFRIFRPDFGRLLENLSLFKIDVLQAGGSRGVDAGRRSSE